MKYLVLFILISCKTSTSFDLVLQKDIHLSDAARFTVFTGGKKIETSMKEENSEYCAFENLQLKDAVLAKDEELELEMERLTFPNKKIIRYSAWSAKNREFELFCDFTEISGFKEEKLSEYVQEAFGDWAKI